jgi:RNA polymerase subunit RPABC4/transcription elongation factor Spt4
MICSNCKSNVQESDSYCRTCGAAFSSSEVYKCWSCGRQISKADGFCRFCGAGQGRKVSFYYTHLGVWILFALILPFAIFFVWRSPVINKKVKWLYIAIMLFLTGYFCYSFYMALNTVFNEYSSVFNLTM